MAAKYKPRIAITPDVDEALKALKKEYGVQSHNKALRRLLGLSGPQNGTQGEAEGDAGA